MSSNNLVKEAERQKKEMEELEQKPNPMKWFENILDPSYQRMIREKEKK